MHAAPRGCGVMRTTRVLIFVSSLIVLAMLIFPERTLEQFNTFDDLDDVSTEVKIQEETSHKTRKMMIPPNKKDPAGEWFEKPMVLREDFDTLGDSNWLSESPMLTFISVDYKIGPIFALKRQLEPLGVKVKIKSLSSFCDITDSCAKLGVFDRDPMSILSEDDKNKFWRLHKNDPEFKKADGFICIHPVSLCELFIPFDKPLILVIDGRYEMGRTKRQDWRDWNENLKSIFADKQNIVVATNAYDMEYVRYFTGLAPDVVPFACEYVKSKYHPSKHSFLLMPLKQQGFERIILESFKSITASKNMTGELIPVLSEYGASYTLDDLRQHAGIVVIPHQVSFLALTEILRLNIPLYMPTVELYARWHVDAGVITDRSLPMLKSKKTPLSALKGLPDPNDNARLWAVGFWLTFAEYFSWPGVKHFNSLEDLAIKLNSTTGEDLFYASERTRVFNEQEQTHIDYYWKTAIHKLIMMKNKDKS